MHALACSTHAPSGSCLVVGNPTKVFTRMHRMNIGGRASFGPGIGFEFVFVFISHTADGPQHARLPFPPTVTLPMCLRTRRIFPSFPRSRLMNVYRDASAALLQVVNQWLKFTRSPSHNFRYGHQNENPFLRRSELTTSALLVGI